MPQAHLLRSTPGATFPFAVEECMPEEFLSRRHDFREGIDLRLADHQFWTVCDQLQNFSPLIDAEELDLLLEGIDEAEDLPSLQRAQLALLIFLLVSNYHLTSTDLQALLTFPPGSNTWKDTQNQVHTLSRNLLQQRQALKCPKTRHEPVQREISTQPLSPIRLGFFHRLVRSPTRWLFDSNT